MGGTFEKPAHVCYQEQLAAQLERDEMEPLPIQLPAASKLEYYDKPIPPEQIIEITPSSLPQTSNITFPSSTYFTKYDALPTPAEVRSGSGWQKDWGRPPAPYNFPSRRLLVKWGPGITSDEARSQWAMWHHFKGAVPVPEVYGWCVDEGETFIFMEMVDGDLVGDVWGVWGQVERVAFCEQLRGILKNLSRATQGGEGPFLGTISKSFVRDECWASWIPGRLQRPIHPPGPFSSVKDFHDYFVYPDSRGQIRPARNWRHEERRSKLPDDTPIVFAQNDLHPYNIIVQGHRIVSLIDWEYSGWFPAYWTWASLHDVSSAREGWPSLWYEEVRRTTLEQWDDEIAGACSVVNSSNCAWN